MRLITERGGKRARNMGYRRGDAHTDRQEGAEKTISETTTHHELAKEHT